MDSHELREVRRDEDNELCGYVKCTPNGYVALTVFHGKLNTFDDETNAFDFVASHALPSLQERWNFRSSPEEEWQTVLIQEARPGWARLTLGYYAIAGIPTADVRFDGNSSAEICLNPLEP